MNIKIIKTRVENLLNSKPELRDDDNRLLSNLWYQELKDMGRDVSTISAYALLQIISEGKLTQFESVRRCRQKLQELNPGLRGENYLKRKESEKKFRKQVQTFN